MIKTFKKFSVAIFTAIFTFFFLTNATFAHPFPSDNFDSYSAGDLSGNNGGTGWSAAWGSGVSCQASVDVVTTSPQSGTKSVQVTNAGDECGRSLTAVSSDTAIVYLRATGALGGEKVIFALKSDASIGWQVELTGTVAQIEGATTQNCGGGTGLGTGVWYKITTVFDTAGTGSGSCAVDAASQGTAVGEFAAIDNINLVNLNDAGGTQGLYDTIDTSAAPPAAANVIFDLPFTQEFIFN